MPKTYEVTSPDGKRTIEMTGERAPSESEIRMAFAALDAKPPPPVPTPPATDAPFDLATSTEAFQRTTMNDPLKRVGIGMEKGFENTVLGAGKFFSRLVGADGTTDALNAAKEINRPSGTAERIGYGAEQLGEFLALPTAKGGAITRAVKEGAQAAGLTAAQGGDPTLAAAAGAAGPLVGRAAQAAQSTPVVQRVAGAIKEGAEKRIAQALGATKERFKAMAEKLAPEMLKRGVPGRTGASRGALLIQAQQQSRAYGKAIDGAIQGAKDEVVPTGQIVDALEEAKSGFTVQREMSVKEAMTRGLAERAKDAGNGRVLVDVLLDERPIEQLSKLQRTLAELGDTATVEQIVAVRRVWDDVVSRAGGHQHRRSAAFGVPLAEQSEAWAKREATSAIRKVLAESQPNIAGLNKEYAFWKSIQDVLTATQKRTQAQQGGLGRTIVGGAGMAAGAAAGGNTEDKIQNALIGAGAGGMLGARLMQAVTSPRWRFVSANARNALADAITSGSPERVALAVARVTAGMNGGLRPVASH